MGTTIFECRGCAATCQGRDDGTFLTKGWARIARIDGPNAICPTCAKDPHALDALKHDGYENATVVPGVVATDEPCWTCGGSPPESGVPCICKGTNSHDEEVMNLRLLALSTEQAEAGWARAEARVKALEAAARAYLDAMGRYFVQHGAEHEDDECPEDDTCECSLVLDVNRSQIALTTALGSQT